MRIIRLLCNSIRNEIIRGEPNTILIILSSHTSSIHKKLMNVPSLALYWILIYCYNIIITVLLVEDDDENESLLIMYSSVSTDTSGIT